MVSIIVPIYNTAQFLPKCIESIQNQTYTDIQIVLVDDGSTDESGKVCDEYAKNDNRITVVYKENGGLSDARNFGLTYCKGEYIIFVDGDDTLKSNAIETAISYMSDEVDIVQYKWQEVDSLGAPIGNEYFSGNIEIAETEEDKFKKLYEIGGPSASACTKLYRKHIFDILQFKVGIIHEDEFFTAELLQNCRKIIYIDLPLYNYFIRSGSIVTSPFSPKKMILFELINNRIALLNKKGFLQFEKYEYRRLYTAVLNLYVSAKVYGYSDYLPKVKKELKQAPLKTAKYLSFKDRLIFYSIKSVPAMLDLYALIKNNGGNK